MRRKLPFILPVLMAAISVALVARPASSQNSHNLWRLVHGVCVTDRRLTGLSAPCVQVDLQRGFAVLRDPRRRYHLLVVPTRKVSGIGSPKLLEPGSPNYWQDAWEARRFLDYDGKPLPREATAMAINSVFGRSQGQLHIHIGCIRLKEHDALEANAARFSETWTDWPFSPYRRYQVRVIKGETLEGQDPFRLLAENETAAADLSSRTLIVVATRLADGPGFFLIEDPAEADHRDTGHGEEMLDERNCAVMKASPPAA